MEKTFKVTNDKGNDFLVRIVEKGEFWGRNMVNGKTPLLHEKNDPLVVIYDADGEQYELTYAQVAYRQLNPLTVGAYYLSTLINGETVNTGITFDGRVPRWRVDKENWRKVIEWLMAYDESKKQLIKEG